MKNIKYYIIVLIAFLLGAQSNFNQASPQIKTEEPKKENQESAPTKVIVAHTEGTYLMEINSIPEPFDIAGSRPYVLWINGHRFNVPKQDLKNIIAKIGKENIPAIDRSDIHKGWMRSFFAEPQTIEDLIVKKQKLNLQ